MSRWTSPTPASSPGSAALTLGLSAPAGAPSASRRSTRTPRPSSPSDGPTSPTLATFSIYPETGQGADLVAARIDVAPPIAASDGARSTERGVRIVTGATQPSGPAAFPARISASPGSDEAWEPEPDRASPSPSSNLPLFTDPGSSSSRTYRDFSAVMAGETWRRSSVRWSNSGTAWDTGCSTLATSECRSADGECSSSASRLADVLEPSAPQRFYLSARAVTGILRRASKRGRELPAELHSALTSLSARSMAPSDTTGSPIPSSPSTWATSASVRRLTPVECERLMGWPDGWTIAAGWTSSKAAKPRTTSGTGSTAILRRVSTATATAHRTRPTPPTSRRAVPNPPTPPSHGERAT